jgi:hypothetical protein
MIQLVPEAIPTPFCLYKRVLISVEYPQVVAWNPVYSIRIDLSAECKLLRKSGTYSKQSHIDEQDLSSSSSCRLGGSLLDLPNETGFGGL